MSSFFINTHTKTHVPPSYILNRGWIDHSERHIPTYEEITTLPHTTIPSRAKNEEEEEEEDTGALSASSFDSLASHFEASYNHRFEEPGASTIPSFPRTIRSTVRRADTTRKEARERRKKRREEEVERRREEVRVLKALKMREVRRKLEVIGREAGVKVRGEEEGEFVDEALRELDLDGDWSPEKHDRGMAGLFEREEEEEDGLGFDEDGKPVWEDDIEIEDIVREEDDTGYTRKEEKKKRKKKKKKKEQAGEEGGAVDVDIMDADAEVVFDEGEEEEWDGTEEMRKRVLKRYMDGLDSLDFNDMVNFFFFLF